MRRYLFSDEAGDFNFSKKQNASKYFIICAVAIDSCDIGTRLFELRRELAWSGESITSYFHATTDTQAVRDRVFDIIENHDFQIFAQIMEKSKAQPQVKITHQRFYQYGWHYLFQNAAKHIVRNDREELMVTTASIATAKGQKVYSEAVNDVLSQSKILRVGNWQTFFCSASSDPCLQLADYCTWAIQRKWERGDARSYDLIKHKIKYEYNLWGRGTKHYY